MRKTFGLAGIVLVAVICVHGYPAASHAGMLSSGDIFELRPLRVRQSVDDDFVAPGWFRFLGNFLSAAPRQTDLRLTTEDQLTIVIPALNESHVIAHYAIISAMSVVGNEFIFDVDDVMTTGEGAAPFAIYSARELVTPIGRLSPGTYTVTVRTSRFRPVNYDPMALRTSGPTIRRVRCRPRSRCLPCRSRLRQS